MWSIKKHLRADEKVIYEGNPEWFAYIRVILGIIATFIVMIIATIYVSRDSLITIIVPIGMLLYMLARKKSTKYIITDFRLIGRYGIINEAVKSVTFRHVSSVQVSQSILGKIFSFGTIILDSTGTGTDVEFVWNHVKNPIKVKNEIDKHVYHHKTLAK